MERHLSRNSSITDSDFEDVSSFSSIDSYKPEPFTGNLGESPERDAVDTTLVKNDTIIRHDTRGSTATNGTHTPTQGLNSKTSANTLQKQTSQSVERTMTHNALNDNVETVETLAAKGLDGTQKTVPDVNTPLTMTKTSEFPEEYNIETDTGLVKMKTIYYFIILFFHITIEKIKITRFVQKWITSFKSFISFPIYTLSFINWFLF